MESNFRTLRTHRAFHCPSVRSDLWTVQIEFGLLSASVQCVTYWLTTACVALPQWNKFCAASVKRNFQSHSLSLWFPLTVAPLRPKWSSFSWGPALHSAIVVDARACKDGVSACSTLLLTSPIAFRLRGSKRKASSRNFRPETVRRPKHLLKGAALSRAVRLFRT